MIDIALIREMPDWVATQIAKRGVVIDTKKLLALDTTKRKDQGTLENYRAEKNRLSKNFSPENVATSKSLGEKITKLETKVAKAEKKIFEIISGLPNIPLAEVQDGGKESNKVVRTFGKAPQFDFKPKDHVELCTSLGLVDYERAAKMSGSGTWVYTGMGARLEWALLNYFIDFHVANGYTFVMPPYLLNYESGYAAGQFPKFQDEVFVTDFDKDPKKSKFLLPTAETALINMHRDEIIPAEKLPLKYAGYSACFRKECASYGSKERGMIRGYQFNKIEMFIYCLAQDSPKLFEELVRNAEKLMEGLGLHFQTVALAVGDLGPVMAKTYDIEVLIPSFGFKEVSSCSTATDYQARRAKVRTRSDAGNIFVHTLNASGLATSRLIPAIVEQFQTADGRVNVPVVLQKYLGGVKVL